jgi:hypothetical protein
VFVLADAAATLEGNREKADPARVALRCGEITIHRWADGRRTYEGRPCRMADQFAMFCGRLPKVTWTVMVCEPLRIFKVTCSPTLSFEIRACSWLMSETGLPSTATMTSPQVTIRPAPVMATRFSPLMPAFWAGLPGPTSATTTPLSVGRWRRPAGPPAVLITGAGTTVGPADENPERCR